MRPAAVPEIGAVGVLVVAALGDRVESARLLVRRWPSAADRRPSRAPARPRRSAGRSSPWAGRRPRCARCGPTGRGAGGTCRPGPRSGRVGHPVDVAQGHRLPGPESDRGARSRTACRRPGPSGVARRSCRLSRPDRTSAGAARVPDAEELGHRGLKAGHRALHRRGEDAQRVGVGLTGCRVWATRQRPRPAVPGRGGQADVPLEAERLVVRIDVPVLKPGHAMRPGAAVASVVTSSSSTGSLPNGAYTVSVTAIPVEAQRAAGSSRPRSPGEPECRRAVQVQRAGRVPVDVEVAVAAGVMAARGLIEVGPLREAGLAPELACSRRSRPCP